MHPFRFAMLRGPTIARAPENDEGFDLDLDLDADDAEPDEPDEDTEEDEEPDEPDEGDEPDDEPEQRAAPTRKPFAQRVEEVADRRVRERTQELERQIRELRQNQAPAQPRETPEQFQQRLAQMEPWERTEYLRQQDANFLQQRLNQIEFNSKDSADRTAYEALSTREPVAAKLKADVEARLQEMRANGMDAPRETILKFLIGERALANKTRATNRTSKAAAARREAQTARPSSGRGDTPAGDRRQSNDRAARSRRLADTPL